MKKILLAISLFSFLGVAVANTQGGGDDKDKKKSCCKSKKDTKSCCKKDKSAEKTETPTEDKK